MATVAQKKLWTKEYAAEVNKRLARAGLSEQLLCRPYFRFTYELGRADPVTKNKPLITLYGQVTTWTVSSTKISVNAWTGTLNDRGGPDAVCFVFNLTDGTWCMADGTEKLPGEFTLV